VKYAKIFFCCCKGIVTEMTKELLEERNKKGIWEKGGKKFQA